MEQIKYDGLFDALKLEFAALLQALEARIEALEESVANHDA